MSGFARESGELRCDGVALGEAARRFGTPLYVYSAQSIRDAFAAYDRAFAAVPYRVCYALKANGSGAILRLIAGLGAWADIVSGGELRAALRAGFTADRIVFSGVGKSEDEIALGLEHDIADFNAESEAEIERIAAVAARLRLRARLSLRVNPDIDAGSHPYVSTGLSENKFGVELESAQAILRRARGHASLEVVGVQCHIGSQITDLRPLGEAARALAALSRRLLQDGFALKTIDLGGGLGVDYQRDLGPEPKALAAEMLPALEGLPLLLLLEPGRSLVARAAALVTRVLYLKENRAKRFVIVDAGMNDLLRPSLYQAFHRIEPVTANGRPVQTVDVVGPVCETGDFLARGRELQQVQPGELLAVLDAGAYAFAMASNYNMRPRPAEVLVDAGETRLIRRRESFEDLVRTEVSAG
jgi:diaminopimelate decarboxylase